MLCDERSTPSWRFWAKPPCGGPLRATCFVERFFRGDRPRNAPFSSHAIPHRATTAHAINGS